MKRTRKLVASSLLLLTLATGALSTAQQYFQNINTCCEHSQKIKTEEVFQGRIVKVDGRWHLKVGDRLREINTQLTLKPGIYLDNLDKLELGDEILVLSQVFEGRPPMTGLPPIYHWVRV